MEEATKFIIPLVLSPLLALITALITINYKFTRQLEGERTKEKENIRLKILNPLLIAAEDFLDKITDIKRRRENESNSEQMQNWFLQIKNRPWHHKNEFSMWANDEGYYAMSSLYITSLYFYYTSKIRRDFPFIELSSGGDSELLAHISAARTAIGGKYGIWEVMQDSLGTYLESDDGKVKNYRQFCEAIIDENENIWFNRLIDFYRDIHLKRDDHIDNIQYALDKLIKFLRSNLGIKQITYKMTDNLLEILKNQEVEENMPKLSGDDIAALEDMVNMKYMPEVFFVDHIISRIGQVLADDYKPTILKHAGKPDNQDHI